VAKRSSVCRRGRRWYHWIERWLASFYRLSTVLTSLSTAVWPHFATHIFKSGAENLRYIASYVCYTLAFAGLAVQTVRSAFSSDSWTLVTDIVELNIRPASVLLLKQICGSDCGSVRLDLGASDCLRTLTTDSRRRSVPVATTHPK